MSMSRQASSKALDAEELTRRRRHREELLRSYHEWRAMQPKREHGESEGYGTDHPLFLEDLTEY